MSDAAEGREGTEAGLVAPVGTEPLEGWSGWLWRNSHEKGIQDMSGRDPASHLWAVALLIDQVL